jgi:hypothetical protein
VSDACLLLQVGAIPAAIQAMPPQKLQVALTKSIANLKMRDRAIESLKKQLTAMGAAEVHGSAHNPGGQAREVELLRSRTQKAEDEVAELVRVSKASAAAHESQIQELSMEATELRRRVAEHDDSKVRCKAFHPCSCMQAEFQHLLGTSQRGYASVESNTKWRNPENWVCYLAIIIIRSS